MVEDILRTRLMVKRSMKEYKDDKTLQRLLHARQLGLKLIANVTFGYTAANFSGRMACVEVRIILAECTFSTLFFFPIVCFTSNFVFSIAVLPHSPGVVYYHLLLR